MHITVNYTLLPGTNIALIGTKHKHHFSTIITKHCTKKPRKIIRGAITAAIKKLPSDSTLYVGLFINYNDHNQSISSADCAIVVHQLNTKYKAGGFNTPTGNNGLVDTLTQYENIYFYKEWFSFQEMNDKVSNLSEKLSHCKIQTYSQFKSLLLDDTLAA